MTDSCSRSHYLVARVRYGPSTKRESASYTAGKRRAIFVLHEGCIKRVSELPVVHT